MHESTVIDEATVESLRVPSRYGYPWERWFNGEWHRIPWSGLSQDPDAFRGLLYKVATRRRVKVQCYKGTDGSWLVRNNNGSVNSSNG